MSLPFVLLSLEPSMKQVPLSKITQPTGLQRPLILAVDDEADDLLLITQTLEVFGYAFITATDGLTALQQAQEHHPDLILLDIILRGLSGLEVAQELKQNPRTCNIPIIAVTVLARAEDQAQILAAGCDDYISKPYTLEDLEERLGNYLTR